MTKEKLSAALVFRTALRIADSEGTEALSMRKLGKALGVEAMSLYHHVPNKGALLDGIAAVTFEDIELPEAKPDKRRWREQLAELARRFRRVLLEHPGALAVIGTRPATSAGGLRVLELGMAILVGAGFGYTQALYAMNNLATYVVGHALAIAGQQPLGEEEPDPSLPGEEYPVLRQALVEIGPELDVEAMFAQGLAAFLAGLKPQG